MGCIIIGYDANPIKPTNPPTSTPNRHPINRDIVSKTGINNANRNPK